MADKQALASVRRATANRRTSERNWRQAIIAAHAYGCSLREIASAAGVVHSRVLAILREGEVT